MSAHVITNVTLLHPRMNMVYSVNKNTILSGMVIMTSILATGCKCIGVKTCVIANA